MLNEFLERKLRLIQEDYRNLLNKLFTRLNSPDYVLVIDEINIFWYSRRKIVNLILEYISVEQDCYALMAASYLDILDNEHFPFVCLGQTHIIDDTLCHFARTAEYGKNIIHLKRMKEQIALAMQDNIKILERFSNIISILPITLLHSDLRNSKLAYKASMQLISSMFNTEINDKNDFCKRFRSFEDIKNALPTEIQNQLIFTDTNDRMMDFDSKIKRYINENTEFFSSNISESEIFFFMIFQYICQSFDILLKSAQFNIVPYIRFDVAYQYLLIIGSNFTTIPQFKEIIFKSICAHLLYQVFDKTRIAKADFIEFKNKLNEYKFGDKVLEELRKYDMQINKGDSSLIMEVISNHLNNIY